jgi:hypothetical protein
MSRVRCPNPLCRDGRAPRNPKNPLARFAGLCPTCNGAGTVEDERTRRGLGNVGPGKSGRLPDAAPRPGSLAAELAARCPCKGGTGGCTGDGSCCGY